MEKVARICWNTFDWKRPSGSSGKSRGKDAYENKVGFGHEEWLLDDSKIMPDGYHYAFLQPLNVKSGKHVGNTYDIHLITFNTIYRKKEYVGCLHNVECITAEKSQEIFKHYKKCGWLREMKEDVRYAGGEISDMDSGIMFNIRFKFSDADIKYSNRPVLSSEDPNTQGLYYTLMDKKGNFVFEKDEEGNILTLDTNPFTRIITGGEILIDPVHKKIQNALKELLKDQYVQLYTEESDGQKGQRIDMRGILKNSTDWHYFEIKTSSAKQAIREALGQILEYSHYPNKNKAKKMYIVGPMEPDENDRLYLKNLRNTYKNLPIWYRWYSFETNTLSEEI